GIYGIKNIRIKPFLPSPFSTLPLGCINGKLAESPGADFSFHCRPHHKRANTNGQLTELYRCMGSGKTIINGSGHANPTTNGLALDTTNDELGALSHGIDHIGKPGKKRQAFTLVLYGY